MKTRIFWAFFRMSDVNCDSLKKGSTFVEVDESGAFFSDDPLSKVKRELGWNVATEIERSELGGFEAIPIDGVERDEHLVFFFDDETTDSFEGAFPHDPSESVRFRATVESPDGRKETFEFSTIGPEERKDPERLVFGELGFEPNAMSRMEKSGWPLDLWIAPDGTEVKIERAKE